MAAVVLCCHHEARRRSYLSHCAWLKPCRLHKVRLVVGSGSSDLPFRRAAISASRSFFCLLRAEKVEQRAGKPKEETGEQHILQNGKGPAGRFGCRRHIIDLPGCDCREGDNHHARILGSLFGQAQPPATFRRRDISSFIVHVPCA